MAGTDHEHSIERYRHAVFCWETEDVTLKGPTSNAKNKHWTWQVEFATYSAGTGQVEK